jgi:predicted GNAT family acetyltransferase
MEQAPPVIRDNAEQQRFEIDLGGGEFAFAAYNLEPGAIRFIHTVMPESHGGQGLGTALIKAGLAAARERGLKVIPICPFFRAYLKKHPDEQDIVDAEHLYLLRD